MGKYDRRPVWFNFGDLGYPEWVPVSQTEMSIIWQGAQDMINNHDPAAISEAIAITRSRLLLAALRGDINPEWCSRALLCTAIDCYQSGKMPDYMFDIDE